MFPVYFGIVAACLVLVILIASLISARAKRSRAHSSGIGLEAPLDRLDAVIGNRKSKSRSDFGPELELIKEEDLAALPDPNALARTLAFEAEVEPEEGALEEAGALAIEEAPLNLSEEQEPEAFAEDETVDEVAQAEAVVEAATTGDETTANLEALSEANQAAPGKTAPSHPRKPALPAPAKVSEPTDTPVAKAKPSPPPIDPELSEQISDLDHRLDAIEELVASIEASLAAFEPLQEPENDLDQAKAA